MNERAIKTKLWVGSIIGLSIIIASIIISFAITKSGKDLFNKNQDVIKLTNCSLEVGYGGDVYSDYKENTWVINLKDKTVRHIEVSSEGNEAVYPLYHITDISEDRVFTYDKFDYPIKDDKYENTISINTKTGEVIGKIKEFYKSESTFKYLCKTNERDQTKEKSERNWKVTNKDREVIEFVDLKSIKLLEDGIISYQALLSYNKPQQIGTLEYYSALTNYKADCTEPRKFTIDYYKLFDSKMDDADLTKGNIVEEFADDYEWRTVEKGTRINAQLSIVCKEYSKKYKN